MLNEDGTYFHAELHRNGEPFCSVVEAKRDTRSDWQPVELGVEFEGRDELERAFRRLAAEEWDAVNRIG